MVDSPTIFRKNDVWYMTYIVFDGQGYETWLSESDDLLNWESKGKILSFTENTWDANQKARYESGTLKIGLANSTTLTEADEWNTNNPSILEHSGNPVLLNGLPARTI